MEKNNFTGFLPTCYGKTGMKILLHADLCFCKILWKRVLRAFLHIWNSVLFFFELRNWFRKLKKGQTYCLQFEISGKPPG